MTSYHWRAEQLSWHDTTLMAESEEELKSLLMKMKEESEKAARQSAPELQHLPVKPTWAPQLPSKFFGFLNSQTMFRTAFL